MAQANETSPHTEDRDDFKCPICFELLKEPFCLKPCGHSLCKWCLLQLRRVDRSHKCPVCRAEIQDSKPNVEAERKMAQIKSQCPGCDEQIALCGMKQHMAKCPVLMSLQKYDKKPTWPDKKVPTHAKYEPSFVNKKAQRFGQAANCRVFQNNNAVSADIPELHGEGDKNCLYNEQEFNRFHHRNVQDKKKPKQFNIPHVSPEDAQTPSTNYAPKQTRKNCPQNNMFARGNENQDNSNEFDPLLDPNEEADNVTGASGCRPKHLSLRKFNSCALQQPQRASSDSDSDDVSGASSAQDNKTRYDCPFCGQTNLTQSELMKHCQKLHTSENQQVVCPVCASMPWGDPNRKSTHFMYHLNRRHNFEYLAYMDKGEDEASMLARAIKASLQSH